MLLNGCVSAACTQRAVAIVRSSAQAAGRDPDAIEIACSTVVAVDANPVRARDAARPLVATCLAEFPNVARESGVAVDLLERIRATYLNAGPELAGQLVSDAIVSELTCAGTVADVTEALNRCRRAGVQLPVLSFVRNAMIPEMARVFDASNQSPRRSWRQPPRFLATR